jgi:zinc transporter 1
MIVFNGVMFVAELVTGYVTKSLSMQSDAWHMLSDEVSLIIGLVAHKTSKKPPTDAMTFGWARAEVLGGLVNATFLLAVCMTIFFDAIERFITPQPIEQPLLFLIVGGLGLVANLVGMVMFCDNGHSDNIRGVFLHVFGDFLGSIGVCISALVYYFVKWPGKVYIDPAFSLIIVGMLVHGSVDLFRKTARTVMERCPDSIKSVEVREQLMTIQGVISVHELHIWELSKFTYIAMIHLVVDKKDRNSTVLAAVHNTLIAYGVYSSTVQIEFQDDFPEGVDNTGSCFYASSYNKQKRAFLTPAVYRHTIGCPHLNIPGEGSDDEEHSHDHDHDHHNHIHHHSHHRQCDPHDRDHHMPEQIQA